MPFVIAEPCIDVQDQACVSVCPVACIHFDAGKDRKLYIDPNECIDCGACEPACPVKAIYAEFDRPINAKYDIDAPGIAIKMRHGPS
jgi:NAD-dependent dihydropyrimidine dehydrogenase PreA subunit